VCLLRVCSVHSYVWRCAISCCADSEAKHFDLHIHILLSPSCLECCECICCSLRCITHWSEALLLVLGRHCVTCACAHAKLWQVHGPGRDRPLLELAQFLSSIVVIFQLHVQPSLICIGHKRLILGCSHCTRASTCLLAPMLAAYCSWASKFRNGLMHFPLLNLFADRVLFYLLPGLDQVFLNEILPPLSITSIHQWAYVCFFNTIVVWILLWINGYLAECWFLSRHQELGCSCGISWTIGPRRLRRWNSLRVQSRCGSNWFISPFLMPSHHTYRFLLMLCFLSFIINGTMCRFISSVIQIWWF